MGGTPLGLEEMDLAPEMELSLTIDFDELFALRDRIRSIADRVRAQLYSAGLNDRLQTEVFDEELELRGPEGSRLLIRLDSFRLEITGAPPDMQVHLLAAIILEEAEVFRLAGVDAGFSVTLPVRRNRPLNFVGQAFSPIEEVEKDPMLDRRFSMTWDWGNATTGYSFYASDTEDRELFLSFKAREGYMTVPELKSGHWIATQAQRFDGLVARFLDQIGWSQ